jgi:hypothetical protein
MPGPCDNQLSHEGRNISRVQLNLSAPPSAPPEFTQSENRLAYIAVTLTIAARTHTEKPLLNVNIRWFNFWFCAIDGFGRHNENYICLWLCSFCTFYKYISTAEREKESAENAPNLDECAAADRRLIPGHNALQFLPCTVGGYRPPTCARTHRLLIGRRPSAPDTCDNAPAPGAKLAIELEADGRLSHPNVPQ